MTTLTEQQKQNRKKARDVEKRTIVTVFWQDTEATSESDLMSGRTWRNHHDPKTLYTYDSNEVNINVHRNGAISMFDRFAEHHIYFYPDQIKYLREALRIAESQIS